MKRVIKFIKENILGIKPIFRKRVKYFWWSNMWCYIEYTFDNGWSWHPILSLKTELCNGLTYKVAETASYHIDYVENTLKALNTLEDCIAHNKQILDAANKSRDELHQRLEKRINTIKNCNLNE